MKKLTGLVLLLALFAAVAAQAQETARTAPPDPTGVQAVPIVNGLNKPLYATSAGDGSGRLFIVEQGGRIWIVRGGQKSSVPFLDLSALVSPSALGSGYSEQGLLGLAFDPAFVDNGRFFVNYTDTNGDTVVARYSVAADNPDAADPNSAVTILTQDQPFPNHNGGDLQFGPDGFLYVGLGDGGSGGDPQGNGQNLGTWLGKMLRIDVSGDSYTVPDTNPFVNTQGALPEIWSYGFRNPWRFSFDRATGDLYIGDVGQNQWEEVNFQPADSPGGENYGWNIYEGAHPYSGAAAPADMVLPVAEYSHRDGIAVTGGYAYRGSAIADLVGVYLYADFGTGMVWSLYRDADGQWQNNVFMSGVGAISSFAQDDDGELYLVNYGGSILKLEPTS